MCVISFWSKKFPFPYSHREFRLRNGIGKTCLWKKYMPTLTAKSRGGKIFEFLHCPFEGRANMHHKIQPN
jgi:hypothetical protein